MNNIQNTLGPDGGKASPINFLLTKVKGPISSPSEDANPYQSCTLPLPGIGDVEETFHVCCNHLFSTKLHYQSHLIEKAETDMVHEFKLHEMGLLRCTLCSMWVQNNGMSLHLRKFHGIVKVTKNARVVPTSVSQCSSDNNVETTIKSGKSYVIKVSGQTVVAGQSLVGTPTSKSNSNEMSAPIASVSKPTLKFISSGGNIYPNIRFQNATGGIGGKVIVRQSVPSNSVPVVTYGSRIIMKANANTSEAKNGKPFMSNAGVRKILPSGSVVVQNNSPFAKTINGLTTMQISGGNIVATTSTGKLSNMKGQVAADEGKPLININKKICRTFKVVEKKSNNKTVSLTNLDLEEKKKTKGADATVRTVAKSPGGESKVSIAKNKGASNKKKPSVLEIEEPNEKFGFLNYSHSEDIFEEFALSLEKIKKEKESLAKKAKPSPKKPESLVNTQGTGGPGEKNGSNGKAANSKPVAKKKCRKQVLKPVLEPEGDVNMETPLTSKVKVRKKAKNVLASSESVSPKVGKKTSPNTPVQKKHSRKFKENKSDTPKPTPKMPQQTPKGKRVGFKKKRPVGRPRREKVSEANTSNLSGLDTLFDEPSHEDVENELILSPKHEEEENVPTVELDLFTLSSLNEKVSVLLTEPKNPDFKVYASMDAIFVGDSALGDVTNQIGYVTDCNNVVFVNPGHFLFPNVQELDKFVPRPILTVKEKVIMSPRKMCKVTPDSKSAVTCKENQHVIESPKGIGRNRESPGNKRQPKISPAEKKTSVANVEAQSYTGPKRALKDKSKGLLVSSNDVARDSKENVPIAKLDCTSGNSKGVRVRRRSARYSGENKDEHMPLTLNKSEELSSAGIEIKKDPKSRKVIGSVKLGTSVKGRHLFTNQESIDCNKELKVVISPIKLEFQNLVQDLKKGLKKLPEKHRVALSFDDDCLEKTAPTKGRDSGIKDSEAKFEKSDTSILDNIRLRTRSADSVPYGKGSITDSLSSDISDNVYNRLSKRKGRLKSESDASCRTQRNSEETRISEQEFKTTALSQSSPDNKDSGSAVERNSDVVSSNGRRKSFSNSTSENLSEQDPLMPVMALAENSVIKGKNFDITNVPSVIRNRPIRERRPSSKWLESLATGISYRRLSSPKLRTERSLSDTTGQSSSGKLVNSNESAKVLDIKKVEDEGRPTEIISGIQSEEAGMSVDNKHVSVVDVQCSSEVSEGSQNEVIMSNVERESSDRNEMSAIVTSEEASSNDDWEKVSEMAEDGVQDLSEVEESVNIENSTDVNSKDTEVYHDELILGKINGSQKISWEQLTEGKNLKKAVEYSSHVESCIEDIEILPERQDGKDAIMESAPISEEQLQPIEIGSKEIASEVCHLFKDDNQVSSMKTQQESTETYEGTGCDKLLLQSESLDENNDDTKFDLSEGPENAEELDNMNAILVSKDAECKTYAEKQISRLDSFSESTEENCTGEDLDSSKETISGEDVDTVEDEEVVIQRKYKVDPCRSSRLSKVIKIDEEISITVKQEEQANIFYSLSKGDMSDAVIGLPEESPLSVRNKGQLSGDMEEAIPAEGVLDEAENLLQNEKSELLEEFEVTPPVEKYPLDCEENTKEHFVQSTPKIPEQVIDGSDNQEVKITQNELEENESSECGHDEARKELDQAANNVSVNETENLQVGISEVTEGDVEPIEEGGLIEKSIQKIVENKEVSLVGHEKNELKDPKLGNNSKENNDKISEFFENFDFDIKQTEEFCEEEINDLELRQEVMKCKVSNCDGGDPSQPKILDSMVNPNDGVEEDVISNIADMEKSLEEGISTDVKSSEVARSVEGLDEMCKEGIANSPKINIENDHPANVDSSRETVEREVTIGVLQMREVSENDTHIDELKCKDGFTGDEMPEDTTEFDNDAEVSIKEVPITNCVTSTIKTNVTQKVSEDLNISCSESQVMGDSSLPSEEGKSISPKPEREGYSPRSTRTLPPIKTTLVLSPSREWHVRDAKLKAQVLIQDQQSGFTHSEMQRSPPKSASHLSPLKVSQELSPPRNGRGAKLKSPVLIQDKQTYNTDSEMERKSPKSSGLLSPSKVSPELSPHREWLGRGAKLIAQVLIQDQQTGVTDSHVVCSSLGITDIKKGVEPDGSVDAFSDHVKSEKEKTCSSTKFASPNISDVSSSSKDTEVSSKSPKPLLSPGSIGVSIKSPKPVKLVHDDREWQPRGAKLKAQIRISDQQNGEMNTLVELTENSYSPVLKSPPAKKARLGSPPANMKDIRSFFTVQKHTELRIKKGANGWEISPKSSTSSKANQLIADSPSTPSSSDAFRKSRSPSADSASELCMPDVDTDTKSFLKANPITVPSGISSKLNGKINHHVAASSSTPVSPSISTPSEPNCMLSPHNAESSNMLLSPDTSEVKPDLESIDASKISSSPPCISSNKNSPQSFKRRKLKLYSVTSSDIRTFFAPVKSNKRKLESSPPRGQSTDGKREENDRSLMKIPKTVSFPEIHPVQTTCHSSKITSGKSQMSDSEASPDFEGFSYGSRQSGLRARTLVRLIKLIKSKQWCGVNNFPFPLDQLCDWNDGMLEDRIFDKYS